MIMHFFNTVTSLLAQCLFYQFFPVLLDDRPVCHGWFIHILVCWLWPALWLLFWRSSWCIICLGIQLYLQAIAVFCCWVPSSQMEDLHMAVVQELVTLSCHLMLIILQRQQRWKLFFSLVFLMFSSSYIGEPLSSLLVFCCSMPFSSAYQLFQVPVLFVYCFLHTERKWTQVAPSFLNLFCGSQIG